MDRWACVNFPELPLQLLQRHHPEWRGQPVVVVDHDKPNGVIQWSNEAARAYRILPGMRFATGLSLCSELRAGVVNQTLTDQAIEEVTRELRCFSPSVEPAAGEPGVFWLDASGLRHLYPSLDHWAETLQRQVRRSLELYSLLTVGFTRFGTYALARSMRVTQRNSRFHRVLPSARDELKEAARVPLDRLSLPPKLRDALFKLGIRTVGDFVKLPPGGLKERFGSEAFALHKRMAGLSWQPLQGHAPEDP
ncbi:MAG: DNA polymerase Y family protein, partial [Myxococcota bacterium]